MTNKRTFTDDEDNIIRACHAGEITATAAIAALRCGQEAIYRRMRELGLRAMAVRRVVKQKPPVPDAVREAVGMGWIPVAHNAGRGWRELPGAPMTMEDACAMRDAGLALTAQKRVDGGFDLMVRVK